MGKSDKEKKKDKAKHDFAKQMEDVIRRTAPGSNARKSAVAIYAYITKKRSRNVADGSHVLVSAPQNLKDDEAEIDEAEAVELIATLAQGLLDSMEEAV